MSTVRGFGVRRAESRLVSSAGVGLATTLTRGDGSVGRPATSPRETATYSRPCRQAYATPTPRRTASVLRSTPTDCPGVDSAKHRVTPTAPFPTTGWRLACVARHASDR